MQNLPCFGAGLGEVCLGDFALLVCFGGLIAWISFFTGSGGSSGASISISVGRCACFLGFPVTFFGACLFFGASGDLP